MYLHKFCFSFSFKIYKYILIRRNSSLKFNYTRDPWDPQSLDLKVLFILSQYGLCLTKWYQVEILGQLLSFSLHEVYKYGIYLEDEEMYGITGQRRQAVNTEAGHWSQAVVTEVFRNRVTWLAYSLTDSFNIRQFQDQECLSSSS